MMSLQKTEHTSLKKKKNSFHLLFSTQARKRKAFLFLKSEELLPFSRFFFLFYFFNTDKYLFPATKKNEI